MSGYYGPGPAPGGQPNRPSGHAARIFGLATMAVLLIATAVSFAVTRSGGSKTALVGNTPSIAISASESGVTFPSTSDPSSASDPTSTAPSDTGTGATASPRPRTTVVPTTRLPPTTPPVQMSVYGVRNVLYKFFDGFLYHRLSDVRSAVCPKYRYLYNGTYTVDPKGYEFQKWRSSSYTLFPGRTYVDIYVAVTLRNPQTGKVGRAWNHTWVIVLQSKTYYVCGIRK